MKIKGREGWGGYIQVMIKRRLFCENKIKIQFTWIIMLNRREAFSNDKQKDINIFTHKYKKK